MVGLRVGSRQSERNRQKHGIDFQQAAIIWTDAHRIEIPATSGTETRWLVIGRIGGRIFAAVITYRNGVIRLISVRRAREREVNAYESQGLRPTL